ncbi:MAG: D-alanine--D-alanine ligase [Eubacteriales bacterium]
MNIVVLCGGLSVERDVSLCTGSLITKALMDKGHNAVLADVIEDVDLCGKSALEYIENCAECELVIYSVPKIAPDIEKLKEKVLAKGHGVFGKNVLSLCMAADIVFMALHGDAGEDGRIQATLDLMDVKYTGSGYLGSAVAMSKRISKMVFTEKDILSPKYRMVTEDEYTEKLLDEIAVPCVVKINAGGSSIGVYVIKERSELKPCMEAAFKLENELVVEEYIEGQEYTCGVLTGQGLPVVEITPNEGFYDYNAKYQPGATKEVCPAPSLSAEETAKMQKIAVKVHEALGIGVYSRVDFIVDEKGDMYCIEANTLPGMTPTSLLPQEAAAIGIGYEDLCELIITESMKKYE